LTIITKLLISKLTEQSFKIKTRLFVEFITQPEKEGPGAAY